MISAKQLAVVALCGQMVTPFQRWCIWALCRIAVRNQRLAGAFLSLLWKQRVLEFAKDETPERMTELLSIR